MKERQELVRVDRLNILVLVTLAQGSDLQSDDLHNNIHIILHRVFAVNDLGRVRILSCKTRNRFCQVSLSPFITSYQDNCSSVQSNEVEELVENVLSLSGPDQHCR